MPAFLSLSNEKIFPQICIFINFEMPNSSFKQDFNPMPQSIDLLTYITLIGTSIGICLGLLLLFIKSEKNNANLYLASFVWLLTWVMLPHFLHLFGLLETFPHVILARVLVPFIGPIFYFYVRACTQKNFQFTPIMWLHFIPFLVNLGYYLPWLMQSGEAKIAVYMYKQTTSSNSDIIMPILRSIHAFIYFAIATRIILRYKKHLTNTTSHIQTAYHRWLLTFSVVLFFPVLTFLFYAFADSRLAVMLYLFTTLSLFLLFVLTGAMIKPGVFHTFPHQMPTLESKEEQTQKYESSNLQEKEKEKLVSQLKAFMEKEKVYQQGDLTISTLAEQIDVPVNYLSQVINEKLNCSFLDFINEYRVKDTQKKLHDPNFEHYTIIAIAYEAGFNSKSAFYSAFKKFAGTTPSKFRKQLALV